MWQVYEVNRNLLWLQSDWQEAALKSVHFTTLPLLIAANLAMADLLSGSDFSIQQRGGQEERLRVDFSRVEYWQSHGAQVSDRVQSLLKEASTAVQA